MSVLEPKSFEKPVSTDFFGQVSQATPAQISDEFIAKRSQRHLMDIPL